MNILIVDDSKAMRTLLRRSLRQAGYGGHNIIEACNGAEALQLVTTQRPDFVLSDWNMPQMTGIELLESLAAKGIRVRFGFITSQATPAVRHRAIEAGAAFLLSKPFTPDSLQAALEAALTGRGVATIEHVEIEESMEGNRLASAESAAAVLKGITGRAVTAVEWRSGPSPTQNAVIGAYRDEGQLVAVCVLDIGLAASALGAMIMLPVGAIKSIVRTARFEDSHAEVAHEVLNVLARLFRAPSGRQPVLTESVIPPAKPSNELLLPLRQAQQIHLALKVPGYEPGKMSMYVMQ